MLEPYKTTIDRWVCSAVMRNQDISVAKAKKAISDYKKAIGRSEGLAELTVFYCESCMNLLGHCGMDDEGYFNALVRMFEQALKAIAALIQASRMPLSSGLNVSGAKATTGAGALAMTWTI